MFANTVYVVKSHKRLKRFFEKTYSRIILEYDFPLKDVYIFVSTEQDYKEYTEFYNQCNVILAPKGICAVDNFITEYFSEAQQIIYMNDDLTKLCKIVNNKFVNLTKTDLLDTLINMFTIMRTNSIHYAGFYNVANIMFMLGQKLHYKTDLCFIQDPFSLCINNKNIKIQNDSKSDFEKSILHFISDGAILRNNKIVFVAENFVTEGGFSGRDEESEKNSALNMLHTYPNYIGSIKTFKDGKTSLRLKPIPCTKILDILGEKRQINNIQQSLF